MKEIENLEIKDKTIDDYESTDLEKLSDTICYLVAEMAAERFQEAVKGMNQKSINALAKSLEVGARVKGSVPLLKMFFLVAGDKCMADVMDFVGVCSEYDESAYDIFFDALADLDTMDWHLVESWLEDGYGDKYTPAMNPFLGGN